MAEPRKPTPHADNDDEAGFPPHPGKDDSAEPDSSEGNYEDDFHEDGGGDQLGEPQGLIPAQD